MSPRVRVNPRISVNKLGEYLVATASRRRAIIKGQKHPSDFIVARYHEAAAVIKEFILNGGTDLSFLDAAVLRLNSMKASSAWTAQDKKLSIEAIEAFKLVWPKLDLTMFQFEEGPNSPSPIVLEGVEVSVRPEILLVGKRRDGSSSSGALKIYLAKSFPFEGEAGNYVATAVHLYMTDVLRPGNFPEPSACIVLDVFGGNLFVAPKAFKRRRDDISAACQEISRGWVAV